LACEIARKPRALEGA